MRQPGLSVNQLLPRNDNQYSVFQFSCSYNQILGNVHILCVHEPPPIHSSIDSESLVKQSSAVVDKVAVHFMVDRKAVHFMVDRKQRERQIWNQV